MQQNSATTAIPDRRAQFSNKFREIRVPNNNTNSTIIHPKFRYGITKTRNSTNVDQALQDKQVTSVDSSHSIIQSKIEGDSKEVVTVNDALTVGSSATPIKMPTMDASEDSEIDLQPLDQSAIGSQIPQSSSDRGSSMEGGTEDSSLAKRKREAHGAPLAVGNAHTKAIVIGGFRRAIQIVAKPPPFLVAVFPWNHDQDPPKEEKAKDLRVSSSEPEKSMIHDRAATSGAATTETASDTVKVEEARATVEDP